MASKYYKMAIKYTKELSSELPDFSWYIQHMYQNG
jgi:hypothetical protein